MTSVDDEGQHRHGVNDVSALVAGLEESGLCSASADCADFMRCHNSSCTCWEGYTVTRTGHCGQHTSSRT